MTERQIEEAIRFHEYCQDCSKANDTIDKYLRLIEGLKSDIYHERLKAWQELASLLEYDADAERIYLHLRSMLIGLKVRNNGKIERAKKYISNYE